MNAFEAAAAKAAEAELTGRLETLFTSQNASEVATATPATFLRVRSPFDHVSSA